MLELSKTDALFVGFKLETGLRHQVENLEGSEARYISRESSENLRICMLGSDTYVGKVIQDGLTSDRVEDVRRNVISIMQRLFPDERMPNVLAIFPCRMNSDASEPTSTADSDLDHAVDREAVDGGPR